MNAPLGSEMSKTSFLQGYIVILVKLRCWCAPHTRKHWCSCYVAAMLQPCKPEWRFGCLPPARTTPGALRNVGLSSAPLGSGPPSPLSPCPLPSPKQGISRTFLFFSPGYASTSHRGAHILPLILRLRAPRRKGAPTVSRYCARSRSLNSSNNHVINGSDCVCCVGMTSLRAPRGKLKVRR